jgi:2-methylcitrate dehydratase PrpD
MILAEFIAQVKSEQIPDKVVDAAKRTLLDSLGCGVAATQTEKGRICMEFANQLGGPPEATLIGSKQLLSSSSAAFANAELIIDLDFDTMLCPPHVSPSVISACMAAAESLGLSGADFLTALITGLEVGSRIGTSISGLWGMGFERGLIFKPEKYEPRVVTPHTEIGIGYTVFGAAASVSKIFHFNPLKIANTFGIASQFVPAPTLAKFYYLQHSPMYKYGLAGACAQAGVMSALLTRLGYAGDITIFDGDVSNTEVCDWERLLGDLGSKWLHVEGAFGFKPYPVARPHHGILDAFLKIIKENNLAPEDIDHVVIKGGRACLVPIRVNREIRNPYDAQFSIPYAIAAAAYLPTPTPKWISPESIKCPKILKFMDKIQIEVMQDIRLGGYAKVMAKGRVFEEKIEVPKGSPVEGFYMTDKELQEKFYTNVSGILSEKQMSEIVELIRNIDKIPDVRELTRFLRI